MRHLIILQHVYGVFRVCRHRFFFSTFFRTWLDTTVIDTKETNKLVLQIEDVVHVLIKYMRQRRSATIQVKTTESYQLCKAAQHGPLEVVQFVVEIVPSLLLFAGISVQLTGVLVEHDAKERAKTHLDRRTGRY